MFANFVKGVSFTCPVCNTSITFDILLDSDEIRELYCAVHDLECPKCHELLNQNASDMLNSICEYNKAVEKLLELEKSTNSRLFD